jgi:hypothetical protein
MKKCSIAIRNKCISNCGIHLSYIFNDKEIINVSKEKCILNSISKIVPFSFIKYIYNKMGYFLIYEKDSLFYLSKNKENRVIPMIMSVSIYNKEYKQEIINDSNNLNLLNNISIQYKDITSIFKLYNNSIPLYFIIDSYDLWEYNTIDIIYFKLGKRNTISVNINDNIKKPIYEIFN